MNEYDNLSDEEIDARLASIDGKLASFDASAGGEPVARPEAPFQDERPKSIDDMTDEEIDARLSQIDTQIGRSPQQPVAAAQRQLTREERIAQNNAAIARAQSQEDPGVLDHIGEGIAEGLRGAGRAAKAIGKGFVGIASGAARLAGTPVRALTGWDGLHRLADSIDSGYDNWGADTLASEYGFDQGTNIGTVGEKIAGLSGTLGSLALGGGVANAAKLPMAVRAGGVALQKSLPWMFGNDAAVRTYDTAKQTAEANGEEFNRARALGLASVNGAIHYLGFKLFENQSLNRMLGMPQAAELAMPGFANAAREGGAKTFSGIVDGVRNGLIKHVVAERAKGALKAGGIMGVQNFLSSLPQQAAEGRDIDWYEALKAGAEGVGEGAFMEGLMGGAAVLRSKAAARKFTADKYFREGYRASNGEHVPGLLHTKEGREFIMKQSPDEQARILDIVSHGGKVSKAELDAACLPPDMKPEELKEFAKDWRHDLEVEGWRKDEGEFLGDGDELDGEDPTPIREQMRTRAKANEARDHELRLAEAEEAQRIAAEEQAADDAAVAAEEAKYSEANARADAERQAEAEGAEQLAREEAYRRTEATQDAAGARGVEGAADVPSVPSEAPQGAEAASGEAVEVRERPNRLRRNLQAVNFRHTQERQDETGNVTVEEQPKPAVQDAGRDGQQQAAQAGARPEAQDAQGGEAADSGVVGTPAKAEAPRMADGYTTKPGSGTSTMVYGPDGKYVGSIMGDGTRYVGRERLADGDAAPWEQRAEAPVETPRAETPVEPPASAPREEAATTPVQPTEQPAATETANGGTQTADAPAKGGKTRKRALGGGRKAKSEEQVKADATAKAVDSVRKAVAAMKEKLGDRRLDGDTIMEWIGKKVYRPGAETDESGKKLRKGADYENWYERLSLLHDDAEWHKSLGLSEKEADRLRSALEQAYERRHLKSKYSGLSAALDDHEKGKAGPYEAYMTAVDALNAAKLRKDKHGEDMINGVIERLRPEVDGLSAADIAKEEKRMADKEKNTAGLQQEIAVLDAQKSNSSGDNSGTMADRLVDKSSPEKSAAAGEDRGGFRLLPFEDGKLVKGGNVQIEATRPGKRPIVQQITRTQLGKMFSKEKFGDLLEGGYLPASEGVGIEGKLPTEWTPEAKKPLERVAHVLRNAVTAGGKRLKVLFVPRPKDVDGNTRKSIGGLFTGTAADYANRSRQGGVDDGPSVKHIGTGEGSQVYGWGLYGSNVRGVAEGYAKSAKRDKALTQDEDTFQAVKKVLGENVSDDILQAIYEGVTGNSEWNEVKAWIKRDAEWDDEIGHEMLSVFRKKEGALKKVHEQYAAHENLYEQTFFTDRAPGDESHLLKWYEPVGDTVAKRVKDELIKEGRSVTIDYNFGEGFSDRPPIRPEMTGSEVYSKISFMFDGPKEASAFLARAGIDGVKYPVDSYGGKGVKDGDKVGWNYVSFRDDNIRVDHKWEDGQLRYMKNSDGTTVGEYDAANGEIRLYPGARVQDVVHEFMHPFVDYARAEAKAGRGELLGKIKDIIDAERKTWEQPVRDAYKDKGEGEILEEIFTHAMGRKGEKLFGKSTTTLEGRRWYSRLWEAIKGVWRDFATKMGWNKADLRGIGDMSPEDAAQMILGEMANGRNLGDAGGGESTRQAFVGRTGAKRLGIGKFAVAERMEKDGADREDIWRTTGWWRGRDGKWRIEIPDAKFADETIGWIERARDGEAFELGSVVDAPELFKAYPDLEDLVLVVKKFNDGTRGEYDNVNGIISINKNMPIKAKRSTLIHELQHAVQAIEGFARGSSPGYEYDVLRDELGDRLDARKAEVAAATEYLMDIAKKNGFSDWLKRNKDSLDALEIFDEAKQLRAFMSSNLLHGKDLGAFRALLPQVENGSAEIESTMRKLGDEAYKRYRRIAGEVEARNAQTRRNYEDRGVIPPWETEDVPASEQIVRMDGEGGAEKVTPAENAAYMDAVKRGDMETAQRMVREAAKERGYEVFGLHGTKGEFTVFDKKRIGTANDEGWLGRGFYFWDKGNRTYAEQYANGGKVMEVMLSMKEPYLIDKAEMERLIDAAERHDVKMLEDFSNEVKANGYDSVIDGDGQMLVFEPNQIKSADPVTYDDAGNVIPLSQRFNQESPDIRESRRVVLPADTPADPDNGVPAKRLIDEKLTRTENWLTKLVDRFTPFKAVQKMIGGIQEVERPDGYFDMRKSTDYVAANDKANGRIEMLNRGLQHAVNEVTKDMAEAGVSPEMVNMYLLCKHAAERNRTVATRNKETYSPDYYKGMGVVDHVDVGGKTVNVGLSENYANKWLAKPKVVAKAAELERIAQKVYKILGDDIELRHESGRLSDEEYKFYQDKRSGEWKHYVPLKSDLEVLEPDMIAPNHASTASMRRNEFMTAHGRGEADIAKSPLAASIEQAFQGIRGSVKNETLNVLYNLVQKSIADGKPIAEIVRGEVERSARKWTFEFSDGSKAEVGGAMRLVDNRNDVLLVKRDGELVAIRFFKGANGLGEALAKAASGESVGRWGEGTHWIPRFTHWLGAMRTQYSPEFIVSNWMADHLEAYQALVGKYGAIDGTRAFGRAVKSEKENFKDLWAYLKTGEKRGMVKEFIEAGGLTKGGVASQGYEMALENIRTNLAQYVRDQKCWAQMFKDLSTAEGWKRQDALKSAWNKTADFISTMNELAEYSTRIGLYSALRHYNVSKADAVGFARDATVNFNRKGTAMPYINGLYMFANATVQGAMRSVQAGMDSFAKNTAKKGELGEHRVRGDLVYLLTAVGVAKAIMDHFAGNDEEREKAGGRNARNQSEYDKKHNVGVPIGGGYQFTPLRFRGPYAAVPYLAQTAANVFLGETDAKDAATALVRELGDQVSDIVGGNGFMNDKGEFDGSLIGQTLAPTIADPFIQFATGKDYKGDDRRRKAFDDTMPVSSNGKRNTWAGYKGLAEFINRISFGNKLRKGKFDFAPEDYQLAAEFLGGGVMSFANRLYSTGANIAQWASGGTPEKTLSDVPLLRSMVREYKDSTSRYMDAVEMYDRDKAEFKKTTELGRRRDMKREKPYLTQDKGRVDTLIERVKDLSHLERGDVKVGRKWVERPKPISEERKKRYHDQRLALQAKVLKILGE